jgi:hypothetical protein
MRYVAKSATPGQGRVHHYAEAHVKKYIREMIDDLRRLKTAGHIPRVPTSPTDGKKIDMSPPPQPAVPGDLNNQTLSEDPLERARQLDFQAQKSEERQRLS